MKTPVTLEPFRIVRARRIRRERLYRLSLGLALGAILFLGLGGLMGCAETRTGPEEAYMAGGDARYDEAGLTTAGFAEPIVVVFAAPERVEKICKDKGAFGNPEACTRRENNICNIVMSPPRDARDVRSFAVWRHELLHCKYGHWHD